MHVPPSTTPETGRGVCHRVSADLLSGCAGLTSRVTSAILDVVRDIRGAEAADRLQGLGMDHLHEVCDPLDVTALRDRVLTELRQPMLSAAVAVGREVLGWSGEFWLDDYLILRINFPYEIARCADSSAENMGIGRLTESVRALYQTRKSVDPTFQPLAYHGPFPPAAWVHGPHVDTWAGHSRDGRNILWAIGDIPADANMVVYPELTGETLPCDPTSLYLAAGYPIPAPTRVSLTVGEMFVFDPQIPHATHLNTSGRTRVAISLRLCRELPQFDPICFWAREFWRRASDIEMGHDEILHLPRESHLASAVARHPVTPRGLLPVVPGHVDLAGRLVVPASALGGLLARRLIVEAPATRVLLVRVGDALHAFASDCPHDGRDLADGGCDDKQTYCPACAVGFDLTTGRSATPDLTLRSYAVTTDADGLIIDVTATCGSSEAASQSTVVPPA